MAVLGSAGLLITGGTFLVSSAPVGQPEAVTASPWSAADPEAELQWARDARVSLASLDRQLAEVRRTEESWNALPAQARGTTTPAAVRALAERKALLQRQRVSIASELASYESMPQARQRLAETERHVASLDRALAEVPRHRSLSTAEIEAWRRLSDQLSMRERQRSAQRRALDGLREGLHEAMATPLPTQDGATREITSAVRELIDGPGRGHAEPHRRDGGEGSPPWPGRGRAETPKRPDILAAPPTGRSDGPLDSVRKAPRRHLPSTAPAPGRTRSGTPLDDVIEPPRSGRGTDAPSPRTRPSTPDTDPIPRSSEPDTGGADSGRARAAYRAANAVISGMPVGDGVKHLAKKAVAREIAERQRRGELSGSGDSSSRDGDNGSSARSSRRAELARGMARSLGIDPSRDRSRYRSSSRSDRTERVVERYRRSGSDSEGGYRAASTSLSRYLASSTDSGDT